MKSVLKNNIDLSLRAMKVLNESISRVKNIPDNSSLSIQEKESCEALTARYSRLCDLLIQKTFRTLDEAELIFEGTIIDRLNRMEKREIIKSAELWKKMRILRNEIAHEYILSDSTTILKDALTYSPELVEATLLLKAYCEKNHLI